MPVFIFINNYRNTDRFNSKRFIGIRSILKRVFDFLDIDKTKFFFSNFYAAFWKNRSNLYLSGQSSLTIILPSLTAIATGLEISLPVSLQSSSRGLPWRARSISFLWACSSFCKILFCLLNTTPRIGAMISEKDRSKGTSKRWLFSKGYSFYMFNF